VTTVCIIRTMDEASQEQAQASIRRLPRAQQERLAYIDFKLCFLGELRRTDVGERFGTAPAGATRDIAQYREIAPNNLVLDSAKVYRPTAAFVPLFDHQPQRVFSALSLGFGEGIGAELAPMVRCELPQPLGLPKMSVLAPISRAINLRKPIRLGYTSVESGRSEREIVPLALVNNAVRWHVRAFDRRHREFRDFVLTRMDSPTVIEDGVIAREETSEADLQWSRKIELELVPHPGHKRPEAVLMDYDMPDGVLRVTVRAAHAGYLLRLWSVDCSPDHRLKGLEYALWLRDPLALYGSTNAQLAPGYVDPKGGR
jgi:WYL domain